MTGKYAVLGKRLPQIDSVEKVTGELQYAGDLPPFPGMLHAKILHCPFPHAKILHIDTAPALAIPGVRAIITHENTPKKEWREVGANYKGRVIKEVARFIGDEVAAVAAVDKETAEKALAAIEIEYEKLPAVFDMEEAAKPGAPQVRPDGNLLRPPVMYRWGDVDQGFKEADFTVEYRCRSNNMQHTPLDRSACIASWSRDRMTLWAVTQKPYALRDLLAEYLDIPKNKVRIVSQPAGGSFGLWWENNHHFIAALLSRMAHRPVRLEMTREEVQTTVKRRETALSHVKLGFRSDGKLASGRFEHLIDDGAYGEKRDPYQTATDLYVTPHGFATFTGVATNTCTAGCMRGVGDLTLTFAIEQAMDIAAEKLKIDPVDFRIKNIRRAGEVLNCASDTAMSKLFYPDRPAPVVRVSSSGLAECLKKGAAAIGWQDKWKGWGSPVEVRGTKRRGIGLGAASHMSGVARMGHATALVTVRHDGTALLTIGCGRVGQGADTTQAQIAAEVLGIPLEDVAVLSGDTDACPEVPVTAASTTARMVSPATKAAAEDARRQILELAAIRFGVKPDQLEMGDRRIFVKGDPAKGITLREFMNTRTYESLGTPIPVGSASVSLPPEHQGGRNYMVHFAEVEVDTETGQVRVLQYVAVHDAGTIMNPTICENQVRGGVLMGAGYTLSENLIFDEKTGAILTPNFVDYKVLSALDMPDPQVMFVETEEPYGAYGIKGIGEGSTCPVPSAIVSAVHNAIGIRINPPITPERVWAALKGGAAH